MFDGLGLAGIQSFFELRIREAGDAKGKTGLKHLLNGRQLERRTIQFERNHSVQLLPGAWGQGDFQAGLGLAHLGLPAGQDVAVQAENGFTPSLCPPQAHWPLREIVMQDSHGRWSS